jgi:carbon-monoxide dehydrogenase large subunit
LHDDGSVTVITGVSPHGQGLVTSLSQIISDELGVALSDITVTFGDTVVGSRGGGTMGSRSLQLGGSAIKKAAEHIRETIMEAAAQLLEVSPGDLLLHDGRIMPVGSPQRSVTIADVVGRVVQARPWGEDSDLQAVHGIQQTIQFQADGDSFPFGTTIAIVSIDRETGRPSIERFISVDDVGNVVNPLLVEGQLIGGTVQGIGEALWEQIVYDENGQLVTGTLMDYAVPRAEWFPPFELDRTTTPSPTNPLGAKGVGEAGTVHAPPAIANAVMDALQPFDVEPLDLPLTMEKLWRVIHFGGKGIR